MIRIPATGVFLDANDLTTVQTMLLVATVATREVLGEEGIHVQDMFSGEGNARAYLDQLCEFHDRLVAERNK